MFLAQDSLKVGVVDGIGLMRRISERGDKNAWVAACKRFAVCCLVPADTNRQGKQGTKFSEIFVQKCFGMARSPTHKMGSHSTNIAGICIAKTITMNPTIPEMPPLNGSSAYGPLNLLRNDPLHFKIS